MDSVVGFLAENQFVLIAAGVCFVLSMLMFRYRIHQRSDPSYRRPLTPRETDDSDR